MKVLVTGSRGFVGNALEHELRLAGHELVDFGDCDVRDALAVGEIIGASRPEAIIHLAGLAQTVHASRDLSLLSAVSIVGTHNVCAAVTLAGLHRVPVLLASTSFVYGSSPVDRFVTEATPSNPDTPYGHAKLAAESVLRLFRGDAVRPYIARSFNHIGPGQSPGFVCSAFARRVFDAPDGGVIEVGNLDAMRDFSDVRDIVRAYRLIIEMQPEEGTFVLGSGRAVRIADVLSELIKISGKEIRTIINPDLLRTNDFGTTVADAGLANRVLGWSAKISLDQTLRGIYERFSPSKL